LQSLSCSEFAILKLFGICNPEPYKHFIFNPLTYDYKSKNNYFRIANPKELWIFLLVIWTLKHCIGGLGLNGLPIGKTAYPGAATCLYFVRGSTRFEVNSFLVFQPANHFFHLLVQRKILRKRAERIVNRRKNKKGILNERQVDNKKNKADFFHD